MLGNFWVPTSYCRQLLKRDQFNNRFLAKNWKQAETVGLRFLCPSQMWKVYKKTSRKWKLSSTFEQRTLLKKKIGFPGNFIAILMAVLSSGRFSVGFTGLWDNFAFLKLLCTLFFTSVLLLFRHCLACWVFFCLLPFCCLQQAVKQYRQEFSD